MNAAEQMQTLTAQIGVTASPAALQLEEASKVLDRLFDEAAEASESPAYVVLLYAARLMSQSAEALRRIAELASEANQVALQKPEVLQGSPEFLEALHTAAERLDKQLRRREKIEAVARADQAWKMEGKR